MMCGSSGRMKVILYMYACIVYAVCRTLSTLLGSKSGGEGSDREDEAWLAPLRHWLGALGALGRGTVEGGLSWGGEGEGRERG